MNVSIRLDPASVSKNSSLFIWFVSFVVSIERNSSKLLIWSNSTDKNRSWVTHVRTKDFGTYNKNWNTSATTKSQVDLWITNQSVLDCNKATCKLLFDFGRVNHPLWDFSLIKCVFNWLFYIKAKLCFYKFRNFFAKDTVTITNCEEVSPSVLSKMW